MQNDGGNFTLNSLINEFPSSTIQSATDCFRLGRIINQFRCLYQPSTQSLSSVGGFEPTYNSINWLNTNKDDDALDELHDDDDDDDDDDAITDGDEDSLI